MDLCKWNSIKKAMVIVNSVTNCDHKNMFLIVCIMVKGMRLLIPFFCRDAIVSTFYSWSFD